MKTIGQILKLSSEFLQSKNCSQGRLEVEYLIASSLRMKRLDLYLQFDRPLDDAELATIRSKIARLSRGEPLAYIEGMKDFYGMELLVNSSVLIPRPETELLVDAVVKQLREKPGAVVWDLCTGSGCIGLAVKKEVPTLDVSLSDLSQEALSVARHNATTHCLAVQFYLGNLLEPFLNQKADCIICNPPYITTEDYQRLDPHVRDFEPAMALTSGKTGLELYQLLSKQVKAYLKPGGSLFLEHGAGQAAAIQELFSGHGFSSCVSISDYSGHERILHFSS